MVTMARRNVLRNAGWSEMAQPNPSLLFSTGLEQQETGGEHVGREKLLDLLCKLVAPGVYKSSYESWEAGLKADPNTVVWNQTLAGRMVLGLGDENVLEAGLRFEQPYGMPTIPGSSVKGVFRSFVCDRYGEQPGSPWYPGDLKRRRRDQRTPDMGAAFRVVFGDFDEATYLQFFDARWVPGSNPDQNRRGSPFVRGILTCHHMDYYGGQNKPPADYDDPNPVSFLAVTGKFTFAVRGPNPSWAKRVSAGIQEALATQGIGGKTRTGFGVFEPVK